MNDLRKISWGGVENRPYESPECQCITINAEGVLCSSGKGTLDIKDWERDEDIDF